MTNSPTNMEAADLSMAALKKLIPDEESRKAVLMLACEFHTAGEQSEPMAVTITPWEAKIIFCCMGAAMALLTESRDHGG